MKGVSKKQSRWGQPLRYQLSELEAYDAMRVFVEAFMRRGDPQSEGLHRLVGFTTRNVELNLAPGDPAMWDDWLDAIEAVKTRQM